MRIEYSTLSKIRKDNNTTKESYSMVKSRRTTLGSVHNRRSTMAASPNPKANNQKPHIRKSMAPRFYASEQLTKAKTPSRRKSIGGDRIQTRTTRSSLAPQAPATNVIKTDPRALSDKKYFNACIRKLHIYLTNKGYENTLKLKDLTRPSAKDFHNFVTFLLTRIHPSFPNTSRKIEDEIASTFKLLGYPFNISKTALVAAGSPHTWPTLLMALTWLIELLECTEEEAYNDENEEEGIEIAGKPGLPLHSLEELEQRTENAFLKYVENSYEFFLAGDDVQAEKLEEKLLMYLEKDNMVIEAEIETATDENAALVESAGEFGKEIEDLPERQVRLEELATDIEKFHELVRQLKEQKAARTQKVAIQTRELMLKAEKLNQKKDYVKDMIQVIEVQELSILDVRKLEDDQIRLENKIEQIMRTTQGHDEASLQSYTDFKKSLAELEALSSAGYNAIIDKLGLINSDDRKTKIELKVDQTHEEEQSKILSGVVLRKDIIPLFFIRKNECTQKLSALRIEILEATDKLGSSEESVKEIREAIEVLETQKNRADRYFKEEKEENDSTHADKLQEVKLLQENIDALQDPVTLEAAITRCQRQCTKLEALREKHQDENLLRKQSVFIEINNALYACAEYKEDQEMTPKEIKEYINASKIPKAELSTTDEQYLLSN